jgi:hypothetical protein
VEAKEFSCSKREEAPLLKIEDGDEPKPKKMAYYECFINGLYFINKEEA